MKVLWITPGYPWPGRPYAGIFFQTQAQALARHGVSLTVHAVVPWIPKVAALLSARHAHLRLAPEHQFDGSVEILRIPNFGSRYSVYFGWPHLAAARKILAKLPFKPDLVHAQFAYPAGLTAVEVGRRLGIPSVITLHGSDVNIAPQLSALSARRFQRAVAGADTVLCVSRALRDKTRLITGLETEYLPIGIDLGRFTATSTQAQARAALDLPQDRAIVLFIGNVIQEKGVSLALEALAHPSLKGALGLFVGGGALGPEVSAQENCLWRGSVPNQAIPDYLAAADVLILPSYAEGLPTVLVEAGACRTPVIATDVGGIPELLEGDRGLMIPPGSVEGLRNAIFQTLEQPAAAQDRASRLYEFVHEAFDADRNAGQLLQIYERLIAKR